MEPHAQHSSETETACIFCQIIDRKAPSSIVYEEEKIISFMTLRPTRPGECLIIPKAHIDHFTDIPDELAAHMMVTAQRIGRKMLQEFPGDRIGMIVHGYGVAHAHLIMFSQQHPDDIVSGRFAKIEEGKVVFDHLQMPLIDRKVLDKHAKRLGRFAE